MKPFNFLSLNVVWTAFPQSSFSTLNWWRVCTTLPRHHLSAKQCNIFFVVLSLSIQSWWLLLLMVTCSSSTIHSIQAIIASARYVQRFFFSLERRTWHQVRAGCMLNPYCVISVDRSKMDIYLFQNVADYYFWTEPAEESCWKWFRVGGYGCTACSI